MPSEPKRSTVLRTLEDGVQVTRTFPGAIVKPEQPSQDLPEILGVCPYCGSEGERTSAKGNKRYFKCRGCVDTNTADWTRFIQEV